MFDFAGFKRLNLTMSSFMEGFTEPCVLNFLLIHRNSTNGADYDESILFGHHMLQEMKGLTYAYDVNKLSFEGAKITNLPEPPAKKGLPGWAIALIVVGSLLVVAGIGAGIWFWKIK